MKDKIIVFGAGQLAEVAYFYLTHDSNYEVSAFIVDPEYFDTPTLMGIPVVTTQDVHSLFPPQKYKAFVAMSYTQLNKVRADKCDLLERMGYTLISYISSKATTWPGFTCGKNCFILEDNTIQPFVTIGNNVTLWSGNHIGHHATIRDNVFITSQVVVSGGVTIGENSFLGVNATLRNHITLGPKTLVAAGAIIMKDTPADTVWKNSAAEMGKIPASKIRGI